MLDTCDIIKHVTKEEDSRRKERKENIEALPILFPISPKARSGSSTTAQIRLSQRHPTTPERVQSLD
jgi:hypothetical protein